MIRILVGDAAPVARLEWSIYKGASGVKEDFTNANVFLWLIGGGDRFLVDCETEDGVIKAVIPRMLPEGVYDLRAMWVKDENCCKRCMSEVEKAFGITYDPEQATPVVGEVCTIKVKSCAATYGYDGLSAYEMSVLKGKTTMTEEEWILWQNSIPSEVSEMLDARFLQNFGNEVYKGISQKVLTETKNDLQGQINAIINDKAVVNLVATPSPVFVGVESTITLVATTDTVASSIKIKKGSTEIASGIGDRLEGSDTIKPSAAGNTTYTAEFTIAGLQKTLSKNVVAVYPIYYGAGDEYTDAQTQASVRATPAGTYNVTVASNGDYVFFVVPRTMNINSAKMSGFDFPLQTPVNVEVEGVEYKYYQSANTYDAGTLTIVIS